MLIIGEAARAPPVHPDMIVCPDSTMIKLWMLLHLGGVMMTARMVGVPTEYQ